MSNWHLGFTDPTNVETALRKGESLCFQSAAKQRVDIHFCHEIISGVVRTDSFQEETTGFLNFDPTFWPTLTEVDEVRWWSIPMRGSFQQFWSVPLFLEICVFHQSFPLRFKIAFLPCDFDIVHTL